MNTVHNERPVVGQTAKMPTRTSTDVLCFEALDIEQRAMHHRIRHAVFVDEQAIFDCSDLDHHDARGDVVRVLAMCGDQAVGAVRLYIVNQTRRLWKGDRLAVLPEWRTHGVGEPLVRFAVAHARAHGGRRMIAQIQVRNVPFFERLGWSRCGNVEDYLGHTHQPMDIVLGVS